ncbi:unconventional myosin-Vb [Denticeps clupeoides]|uniref:unconventional myosin-Vb n=1 Tax=Denticeps clupeoides TaxID=299321 RepID=UPI0010A5211B|nr:unconventional myosin-Vb-like [Denticeps clupeoides]
MMATTNLYTKGACVWVPDPEDVWVSARLLRDFCPGDEQLQLELSDGREMSHPVTQTSGLPPLGNPDILEGENDLTALSFLHEPAVLHNLHVRFLDYNSIYTYCGIVLVAINPYEQLPIYGEEVIDAYSGQDMADMEPHVFSVAEEAYRTMTREETNQSIIISGESGSGKTVSAKFTMRYFAVVGGAVQQTSVEDRVLASNPIMEAIGNAKTTRNDNSSRFGKYIEIGFGQNGDIIGANMRTYLLEKSRVVFQAPMERNYHIFYQLCASRDLPEMRALKLGPAEHFRYTNQGEETQIPGTDDAVELDRTRNAFTILGVQSDQQMELYQILAAVLHLGNVKIQASGRGGDRSYIDADDRSLALFSKLLGVECAQMAHWLCHRRLAVGGEMLVKPMSGQQASDARDALAKHIYGQLFTWTVLRLNAALQGQREQPKSFIGVLDIYGFETFDRNSFEQFCINYANEKLQQQFNRHVFQLEQEEYMREELPWRRIEFSDNQPCITLLEGPLGLLDLLDEECRMPKGSDENWAQKLYDQHLTRSAHFRKPRMSNTAFIILHFADTVQYECEGFLDKNRDTVFEEPINIMKASQSELVAELFQQGAAGGALTLLTLKSSIPNGSLRSGKRPHREHKLTVGFQFRQSLQLLMDTLNSTTPHYIRCIKPNDLKKPFEFDPKRIVQQLRACGVLETIRISAAGYPSRWTYEDFFSRYRVLLRQSPGQGTIKTDCQRALQELIPDSELYCFGKTKVFFRAGQVAVLEKLRGERLHAAVVTIQSRVKGWMARRRYLHICWAVLTLQRYTRGRLVRRLAHTLRYTHAALVVQKTYRMLVVRQLYLMIREATITIQAYIRGMLARRAYRELLQQRAAILLQATVRGWLQRRAFGRIRAAVVLLQCCVRRQAARKELRKLRAEARSVEKYRELNKGMEVKLMQLQLRADHQARESASLREMLHTEREAHVSELEQLRAALRKLEAQLQVKPQKTPAVSVKEEEERQRTEERHASDVLRLTQELQALKVEGESLKKEKEDLSTHLLQQEKSQVERMAQAISNAGASMKAELEEERRRYQGLLREFTRLEQRYENLRDMSALAERSQGHKRTDSSQGLVSSPTSPSFPSPEDMRRASVTSNTPERRPVGTDTSLGTLMEDMGVVMETAEKMKVEDLTHAYDALRVANKFLEEQIRSQGAQCRENLPALSVHADCYTAENPEIQELMEQLEVRDLECWRLRKELKDLRHTVTLRSSLLLSGPAVASPPLQAKAGDVTGLLECKKRDEGRLIKNLITDLRASLAASLPLGLPAQVLFLCVRQADCSGEPTRAHALCSTSIAAIKASLKTHCSDLIMTALWLKNSCLLADLLSQYSTQDQSGLDNFVPLTFNTSELNRTLSDLCIQAYQQLLSITESRLQSLIVPAVLETETIPGLSGSGSKLVGSRRRTGSDPRAAGAEAPSMVMVLREMSALHTAMNQQELPIRLQEQAFRQITYLLVATALNSLILRKDLCCWNCGLQTRYNLSLLEDWLRARGLQEGGAVATLEPLIQAAQLLQMSKNSDADAKALVQTCHVLSTQQIVKLLTLYSPQSGAEERVTLNFIRIVQGLLKERSGVMQSYLLLDVRRVFPVIFPRHTPPLLNAEQLAIPECLKISFLRKT